MGGEKKKRAVPSLPLKRAAISAAGGEEERLEIEPEGKVSLSPSLTSHPLLALGGKREGKLFFAKGVFVRKRRKESPQLKRGEKRWSKEKKKRTTDDEQRENPHTFD